MQRAWRLHDFHGLQRDPCSDVHLTDIMGLDPGDESFLYTWAGKSANDFQHFSTDYVSMSQHERDNLSEHRRHSTSIYHLLKHPYIIVGIFTDRPREIRTTMDIEIEINI